MVLMTMIARVGDGLPLAASMQEVEEVPIFPNLYYILLTISNILIND